MKRNLLFSRFSVARAYFLEGSPIRVAIEKALRGYFSLEVLSVGANWQPIKEIRAKQVRWLEYCESAIKQMFDYTIPA